MLKFLFFSLFQLVILVSTDMFFYLEMLSLVLFTLYIFFLYMHPLILKAWFTPMRLTYLHVYSYEDKDKPIGGNALNNHKKNFCLQLSMRLLVYSHKNNIKMF